MAIRPPLNVGELCERLGQQRGRPIDLIPSDIPVEGAYGLWVAFPKKDYVLYQQQTTAPHQTHIILHELGHIMADHNSDDRLDHDLHSEHPGLLDPDWARRVRNLRHRYDEAREEEAETIASIILEWASVLNIVSEGRPSNSSLSRLDGALGDRRGWA